MAHTATNVLVHFIFSTHHREPLIRPEIQDDLHAYLGGIVREIGGVALSINGMDDHVHLLVRMPSTHSIADVARLVKSNSSRGFVSDGLNSKGSGGSPGMVLLA